MKRIILAFAAAIAFSAPLFSQELVDKLIALPSVQKVEILESKDFPEKFLLYFEQPVDHKDPSKGKFLQRVFVGNVSVDSSSVVVVEGYGAAYAARPSYRDELSKIFNLNNIVIEHRYFLESAPEPRDWKYLTAENAANDYHRVLSELKTVFPKKWISTGISKGGQNTAIYRSFFPDDVDISVPYVGPFCRSREDGRHEPFIADFCGSLSDRKAIQDFQREFLKRRDRLTPKLDSMIKADNIVSRLSTDEIYDMIVLEFSFIFWQWGQPVSSIPGSDASDDEIFKYMVDFNGPDYWAEESPTGPFFVMAAHELGYYGYDTKPFKDLLTIKNAKGYLARTWLPEELQNTKFDKTLSKRMQKFLKTTDCRMLFIYGEFDPWSAVRAGDKHGKNIHIYIDPKGSHKSRISTFSPEVQEEIKGILSGWLYE